MVLQISRGFHIVTKHFAIGNGILLAISSLKLKMCGGKSWTFMITESLKKFKRISFSIEQD